MPEMWTPADPEDAPRVTRVRAICGAFPEATEQQTWGMATFRVRSKIFATLSNDDHDGLALVVKAPAGEQEMLLASGPPFFYPSYVGTKGWIGVHLHPATDWSEVGELVEESYRLVAPRRLAERLDSTD